MDKKGLGQNEYYIEKGTDRLRLGCTTGTCAAAAARGAVVMLITKKILSHESIMTPGGLRFDLPLEAVTIENGSASCGVRKDAGDDPDSTDGVLVMAEASFSAKPGIRIEGGEGVGRVTKPGLPCKVGEAAINPVPRSMILSEAESAADELDYVGGIDIVISVPGGAEIASKTFNPRLGIEGGISILGTTGIVEPMSEKALLETIRLEMKQHLAEGEKVLLFTPGNYGKEYLKSHMDLPYEQAIKCSNYIGETIDMAAALEAEGILFVSHIGKFCKVASGIMNTHSNSADGRMEALAACAVRAGASIERVRAILECGTTDEALAIMSESGILEDSMKQMLDRIQFYLDHRAKGRLCTGAVVFSNTYGYLGSTDTAEQLMKKIKAGCKRSK